MTCVLTAGIKGLRSGRVGPPGMCSGAGSFMIVVDGLEHHTTPDIWPRPPMTRAILQDHTHS